MYKYIPKTYMMRVVPSSSFSPSPFPRVCGDKVDFESGSLPLTSPGLSVGLVLTKLCLVVTGKIERYH